MKKTILITIVTLLSCLLYPQQSEIQKPKATQQHTQNLLNQESFELEEDSALLEYEQQICDHARVAKPSAVTALLTRVGCTMLVYYITIMQKLKTYYSRATTTVTKWLKTYA